MTTRRLTITAAAAAAVGIIMALYARYATRDVSRIAADAMNNKSMYE